MGTNYYLETESPCAHCGRSDPEKRLHIGKSSAGWCFALRVYPDRGIEDLDDWELEWAKPGAVIFDEYGDRIDVEEMRRVIAERRYASGREMLRHAIDGKFCIGHGKGTWDLIQGDFS